MFNLKIKNIVFIWVIGSILDQLFRVGSKLGLVSTLNFTLFYIHFEVKLSRLRVCFEHL